MLELACLYYPWQPLHSDLRYAIDSQQCLHRHSSSMPSYGSYAFAKQPVFIQHRWIRHSTGLLCFCETASSNTASLDQTLDWTIPTVKHMTLLYDIRSRREMRDRIWVAGVKATGSTKYETTLVERVLLHTVPSLLLKRRIHGGIREPTEGK
jgi:hypothetical protein